MPFLTSSFSLYLYSTSRGAGDSHTLIFYYRVCTSNQSAPELACQQTFSQSNFLVRVAAFTGVWIGLFATSQSGALVYLFIVVYWLSLTVSITDLAQDNRAKWSHLGFSYTPLRNWMWIWMLFVGPYVCTIMCTGPLPPVVYQDLAFTVQSLQEEPFPALWFCCLTDFISCDLLMLVWLETWLIAKEYLL